MTSNDNLDRCVRVLSTATSDTERFAALLVITQAVRAENCDIERRRQLFGAIGFDFVKRLLRTKDVPAGCSPRVYSGLALSLLHTFCSVPELVDSCGMLELVPDIARLLLPDDGGGSSSFSSTEESSSDAAAVDDDAFDCICVLSKTGASTLVQHGVLQKLCAIYTREERGSDIFRARLLGAILDIVVAQGPQCWQNCLPSFHVLMNALSRRFVSVDPLRKFDLCEEVNTVMWTFPPSMEKETCHTEPWYKVFNEELMGILCFKLNDGQREVLFKLCAAFVEKLGVHWALGDTEKSYRLFLLLVQLSCVEMRMILEDQGFDDVVSKSELLSACFVVVEHAVHFLVADGRHVVTESAQQQLYQALTGAFGAVLSFLSAATQQLTAVIDAGGDDARPWQLLLAVVRVTGAWLAEETAALRDEVQSVLPLLLRAAWQDKVRHGSTASLYFLLPGLCHLSVEDAPRSLMLERDVPSMLTEYMGEVWPAVCGEGQASSEQGAATLCCGILMNIVVLEADNVVRHSSFQKLLKFVFASLPTVDRKPHLLVLCGNLTVLGLLLLRRHAWKFRANESSIYRFLSSSIRFLWDAYGVEETSDGGSSMSLMLSYRASWDELRELWFLGMQALSSILPEMAWVGQFIVESGWAEEITSALCKVQASGVSENVCREYEGFLCCLVRCCEQARTLFLERGVTRMCSKHKMEDLGRLLRGGGEEGGGGDVATTP